MRTEAEVNGQIEEVPSDDGLFPRGGMGRNELLNDMSALVVAGPKVEREKLPDRGFVVAEHSVPQGGEGVAGWRVRPVGFALELR